MSESSKRRECKVPGCHAEPADSKSAFCVEHKEEKNSALKSIQDNAGTIAAGPLGLWALTLKGIKRKD